MTSDHSPDNVINAINRRNLLRSGTLAAAGAGATVLASAAVPRAAFAADGDELPVGEDNEASSTTSLTVRRVPDHHSHPSPAVPGHSRGCGQRRADPGYLALGF